MNEFGKLTSDHKHLGILLLVQHMGAHHGDSHWYKIKMLTSRKPKSSNTHHQQES